MPEVEKDEVLQQQYHQHSEEVIDIADISDIPTSAVLSNVSISIDELNDKTDRSLEVTQLQQDRPLTAPPVSIERNSLRTFSEPPLTTTMINENKSKFLLPPRIHYKTDYNDDSSRYNSDFTNLDDIPRVTTLQQHLQDDITDPILDPRSFTPIELNRQSWHPHIFAKRPEEPTPHSINYILGIEEKPMPPKSPRPIFTDQDVSCATITEMLNANNKLKETNYSLKYSHQLHDRLVRGSVTTPLSGISSVAGQYNQHYIPRSTSLSECSEDDSGISDQPLNLSITKSRDTSPLPLLASRPVKQKKGKPIFFNGFISFESSSISL